MDKVEVRCAMFTMLAVLTAARPKQLDPDCFTNCPTHTNTPWDVLVIAVAIIAFLIVVATTAVLVNHFGDRDQR